MTALEAGMAPAADATRPGAVTAHRGASASALRVEGLTKRFGNFEALKDLTLQIAPGEFLTLLGPSGSGKSTFLMLLAGFEAPSAGRIFVDDADVTAVAAEERGFGMVFQGYALFPHMTVAQNIAFPLKVRRMAAGEIARRTDEMIALVGLEAHAHKRPAALSGGQQQRVALARALAYRPPVLLLDEPFSALDRNLRNQMQDEMRRLHRESGTTFVFVTHDQTEALSLSTRIAIFDQGRLQQVDTPRCAYDRPVNRFVAEFLGDITILPLTDVTPDGAGRHGQARLSAPPPETGATTSLAVRPEAMGLTLAAPSTGNALPVTLRDIVYEGATTRLEMVSELDVLVVMILPTASVPADLRPGERVWAGWPAERGVFL